MGRLLTWTHPLLHYHTLSMKWLVLRAKNPRRTLYTNLWAWFFHSTHTANSRQSWQSSTKLNSPTLPLHSYPPCAVQIHLVWGVGIFFQFCSSRQQHTPYYFGLFSMPSQIWRSKTPPVVYIYCENHRLPAMYMVYGSYTQGYNYRTPASCIHGYNWPPSHRLSHTIQINHSRP